MGYVSVTSICFFCKRIFMFHPNKVPSIRDRGTRRPVCFTCLGKINAQLRAKAEPEIVPHPLAYVGCPEEEVDWNDAD
jgi:hypothetical protein